MRNWKKIADACCGTPYGHCPGHTYHDVDVTISQSSERLRVEVLETWGSAQGYDEEHGRHRVVAIDSDVDTAVRVADARARRAGMRDEYVVQALSCAHARALDAMS